MSRQARRWVSRNRRLVYSVGVTVGLLLFLELGARLVPADRATALPENGEEGVGTVMELDPARIWRLKEGAYTASGVPVRIDADGFRIPSNPGPDGAPVVLTVGDSSVFGHGVPDGGTLHDQLQAALSAGGVQVRVESIATPGYSTYQSLAALEGVGWGRSPALLVVANLWSDTTFDVAADTDRLAAAGSAGSLLASSAFFRISQALVLEAAGRPTATRIRWPEGESSNGIRRVSVADYVANLLQIAEEARQRSVGLLFLTLTNERQFVRGEERDTDWAPYRDGQRVVAKAVGAPIVDAQAAYQASGQSRADLFLDGVHPTAAGHALLASAVARTLAEAGWPGQPLIPTEASAVDVPPDVTRGGRGRGAAMQGGGGM